MRFMRTLGLCLPALAISIAACQPTPSETEKEKGKEETVAAPTMTPAQRGEYLVTVAGCNDCHSPKIGPEVDKTRVLSGQPSDDKLPKVPRDLIGPQAWGVVVNNNFSAWVGPWGVSFAMNLTPDKETGLGSWTEDMFIKALRTGKHQGTGRDILPPMPWQGYARMTDEDLKAVFAYLQSLPPIKNPIPDPIPPDKVPH
ncbi:MAG TPA: diheme cytochrome c-553 [Terriglobia bacterium]|nr:diheme cytochrome c-553 [Terriglobia bacterium]